MSRTRLIGLTAKPQLDRLSRARDAAQCRQLRPKRGLRYFAGRRYEDADLRSCCIKPGHKIRWSRDCFGIQRHHGCSTRLAWRGGFVGQPDPLKQARPS